MQSRFLKSDSQNLTYMYILSFRPPYKVNAFYISLELRNKIFALFEWTLLLLLLFARIAAINERR